MLKVEKEYRDKYGNIPMERDARLSILIKSLRRRKKKEKSSIFDDVRRINDIEWKTYSIVINLLPKATPRPRLNSGMGLFYVAGSDVNKKLFHKFMKKHPHELICTPMYFTTEYYLPIPTSAMTPREQILAELGYIRPIVKPDFDNVAKTYADMMQKSLILDDALIIEGTSKKFYSIKPRIIITIKYMAEIDSLFNRKKIESQLNKLKGMDDNEQIIYPEWYNPVSVPN